MMDDLTDIPEGRLLKVYPPEGADDNTSVDIIAIHGLGTMTPRTWEYRTEIGAVNWLSEPNMLPKIVPSARIYTFSWNASYSKDAPVIRIVNVAEIFLSNLRSQRDEEDSHSRPLVFIGSCFGGLIITKALEIANTHDSIYRKLLLATSGVVFLGSPLQGARAAKAAEWHVMIAGILNRHPSQTLLQDLDGSTRALRETTHRFVKMITTPPLEIMTTCFWETQKSQVLKAVLPTYLPTPVSRIFNVTKMILVEEDSATLLGRDNKPLDAPHSKMNKFYGPGDANFGLVSDDIQKMVNEAKRISVNQREAFQLHNEHFEVRRRPNPLFTGREDELGRLREALCPSESWSEEISRPKIYVIQGMGGAGKSEVAVKFAHDNRPKFWGIFWIDARTESSITNGFAHIARKCGQKEDSLEGAISWLQNTRHSWLLILDNADNADLDLDQFLPAGRKGSILITTRLAESAKFHTAGHPDYYERLSRETATTLLLKACKIDVSLRSAEENAHSVVDLLGCHALAVIQAGAAISQGLCNLREYKEMFLTQRRTLFDCFPKQARSEYGGVYATFEVSATYLASLVDPIGKDALELLKFYASMHCTDFPEVAFQVVWINSRDETLVSSDLNEDGEEYIGNLSPWHVSNLPTFMNDGSDDIELYKLRFRKARSLLVSLSLVAFDSDGGATHMHPVSHFWSRDRLQKQEKWKAGINGLCVLSLSLKDPYTYDFDQLRSQLQPHIESIAYLLKEMDSQESNFNFQQSIYRLGSAVLELKCDSALEDLLQMIPVLVDNSWIRTQNGQAIQLLHSLYMVEFGDASKAVTLLEQLNEAGAQTLAAEDPKYIDSQKALATAYLANEDAMRAIEILQRIIHVQNETLSPEDESLLGSQHELARAYLEVEDYDKAIALLEIVLEILIRTLRPEHPNHLSSQHVLAKAYMKVEENEKAIALLEKVAEMQIRTLRPEHPDLLSSQHTLARAYMNVEENEKAIVLLETVVEIETRTLRPEHSERLRSQHELARAYRKIGETAEAIALLEKVVEIEAKTLRPEHEERLASQHELARAYQEIRETAEAIALLEKVVEIRTKTLRVDHPDRVRSIYTLAQCHRDAGNYERALQLARSVEDVAQNRRGEPIADWNADLIGYILYEMEEKRMEEMRLEEKRLKELRLEEVD
ncbi:hypothetical protein BDR22DRAFT_854308 [Usnea florida]